MTVTPPPLVGPCAPRYEYESERHARADAALERATRPLEALVTVLGLELDLIALTFHATLSHGLENRPALAHWVGQAVGTARALVTGRPVGQVDRLLTLSRGGGTRRVRLRWTEPSVEVPLAASRWSQALAALWIAGDDALAMELASPAWLDTLARHPHEARVPSRHRLPLCRLLARLARSESWLDLDEVESALAEDIRAPQPGHDGMSLDASTLQTRVSPIVPAVRALGAPSPDATAVRAALAAAAEAERAADRPAASMLLALASLAVRRGVPDPLPSWAAPALFGPGDIASSAVDVEELLPIPALRAGDREIDAAELARTNEAISTAEDEETWSAAVRARGSEEVARHLLAHGAWLPRSRVQGSAVASLIDGQQSTAELLGLPFEPIEPALVVRGLAALDERDLELPTVVALLRPAARALRQAREQLLAAKLAPSVERVVLLLRAVAGEALGEREAALALEAVSLLLAHTGVDAIVLSDEAGSTHPVGRQALVAALDRVAGPSWRTAVGPGAREKLASPPPINVAAELTSLVAAARRASLDARASNGSAIDHRIAALGARGPSLMTHVEPLHGRLLGELRASADAPGACATARAIVALCRLAAVALRKSPGPLSEHDARYVMREPLVLDALPEGERSAARKELMAAIDLLRLEAPGRVRMSWVDAPEPPVNTPQSTPSGPPRRRRIVS